MNERRTPLLPSITFWPFFSALATAFRDGVFLWFSPTPIGRVDDPFTFTLIPNLGVLDCLDLLAPPNAGSFSIVAFEEIGEGGQPMMGGWVNICALE